MTTPRTTSTACLRALLLAGLVAGALFGATPASADQISRRPRTGA